MPAAGLFNLQVCSLFPSPTDQVRKAPVVPQNLRRKPEPAETACQ